MACLAFRECEWHEARETRGPQRHETLNAAQVHGRAPAPGQETSEQQAQTGAHQHGREGGEQTLRKPDAQQQRRQKCERVNEQSRGEGDGGIR